MYNHLTGYSDRITVHSIAHDELNYKLGLMASIKILLADDHKIVRDGIKLMLQPITGIEVVAEANNGNEVMEILDRTGIDLIIMDINMPGMDGIQARSEERRVGEG